MTAAASRIGAAANVRAATIELLRALGMTTVFGNPGSTELRFLQEWPADFRYVMGLQEASVVAMADGFAQITGSAALVNLHTVTGLGHALGNVYTAACNHAPLVITAGQQTRAMLPTEPYLFARDAATFPRPHVKWSAEPARAQDVPAALARAYHVAMERPRGPTFVSIPEDDWSAPLGPDDALLAQSVAGHRVNGEFVASPDALDAVAAALVAAKRPALVVGPQVDADGAWDETVRLAERIGAAVWVSPVSSRCSFPEDHPRFAGFLPPVRAQLAQRLAGHDLVLVLGAPVFTYHVPSEGPFVPPGATLIQMIDDPDAAAFAPVGTSIVTTLRFALDGVLARLPPPAALAAPAAARMSDGATQPVPPTDPISAEFFMQTVAATMPPDAIIVEEASTNRREMHDRLPIRRPRSFFAAASGGLGWALPAAVGVALGAPERTVIALVGDGASLYSIHGLWTAARHRLPIAFVILNNRGYAMMQALAARFDAREIPDLSLDGIDVAAIARGLGCDAVRVDRAVDLAPRLTESFARVRCAGPVLVDVAMDPAIPRIY